MADSTTKTVSVDLARPVFATCEPTTAGMSSDGWICAGMLSANTCPTACWHDSGDGGVQPVFQLLYRH